MALKRYYENKDYYSKQEKEYRLRKTLEDPEYFTEKSKRRYYLIKNDPVKWEEYKKKKQEYYLRKKEMLING